MHRETKNGYLITTYYGLPELMELGAKSSKRDTEAGKYVHPWLQPGRNSREVGRDFSSWDDIFSAAQTRWDKGLDTVAQMRNELENEIPVPKDRKRKRRWSEDDGEVDVDRVMAGDSYCFQQIKRETVSGPSTITLTVNIDGACHSSAEELFWRAAALVTIADQLEEAGYSCEIAAWTKGRNVWSSGPVHHALDIIRLKESGESLDTSYLVNGLSPWCLRVGIFGSFHSTGEYISSGYGSPDYSFTGVEEAIGIDGSTKRFHMPGNVFTKRAAIEAARKIIEQIGQGAVV